MATTTTVDDRRETEWDWSNRTNDERVYGYYNTPLWY